MIKAIINNDNKITPKIIPAITIAHKKNKVRNLKPLPFHRI